MHAKIVVWSNGEVQSIDSIYSTFNIILISTGRMPSPKVEVQSNWDHCPTPSGFIRDQLHAQLVHEWRLATCVSKMETRMPGFEGYLQSVVTKARSTSSRPATMLEFVFDRNKIAHLRSNIAMFQQCRVRIPLAISPVKVDHTLPIPCHQHGKL